MNRSKTFADGFVWGAASAAYQIEGAHDRDGRGPSVWDAFVREPGRVFDGHTGDIACGSYDRMEEDLDLLECLGVNAYRLSVSWPRVIPDGTGQINQTGLDYYDRLIDGLVERNIRPFITLYHWDLPLELDHRGGWTNRDCAHWLADYTTVVVDRLSDRVGDWFTINEPQCFIGCGYGEVWHAPGRKRSRRDTVRAGHHALLGHGLSAQAIRAASTLAPRVGFAPVSEPYYPTEDDPEDIERARRLTFGLFDSDWWHGWYAWFTDPAVFGHYPEDGLQLLGSSDAPPVRDGDMETIAQPLDMFGFNLYQGRPVRPETPEPPALDPGPYHAPGVPMSAIGWPVTPEALYWGSRFLYERYKLPIVVTENGLSGMDWVHVDGKVHDRGRIDFLTRYLHELRRASDDGVPVEGFFHWSIMDNFEWAQGYKHRFGLVYVDYMSGERIPKDSYHWFREVIKTNGGSIPEYIERLR